MTTHPAIRLALAQLDVEPNRPDINVRRVLDTIEQQRSRGADLVVFSEMVVPGYMIGDAFEREAFLRDCEAYNADIAAASIGLTVIWGNVLVDRAKRNRDGTVRKYNAAFAARHGALLPSVVAIKTHLPTYRQFHDRRHFTSLQDLADEEGVPLSEKLLVHDLALGNATHRVGLMLCEDMWWEDYGVNIAAMLRDNGASFLVNLSASPWGAGKAAKRDRVVRSLFTDGDGIPLIYVNNVGFQDIGKTMFAFDGRTAIYDGNGNVVVQAPAHESTVIEVSFDPQTTKATGRTQPRDDGPREIHAALVYAIRQFMANIPLQNVLIGLSGGIDSSVTAALFVEAIGAERVFGINMPTRFNSARTRTSAERLARNLGIAYAIAPIEESFDHARATLNAIRFTSASGAETVVLLTSFDEENVQARIRGNVLMTISNKRGWMVLTTGNKSEMATGYATLYGDMAGGFAVLKDIVKTLVYRLARWRNEQSPAIPQRVIDRAPSAELRPDQKDQDSLPPYEVLDAVVERYMERDMTAEQIAGAGFDMGAVREVMRLIRASEYKRRQSPPGVRITPRSFGKDWRYPITSGYLPRS